MGFPFGTGYEIVRAAMSCKIYSNIVKSDVRKQFLRFIPGRKAPVQVFNYRHLFIHGRKGIEKSREIMLIDKHVFFQFSSALRSAVFHGALVQNLRNMSSDTESSLVSDTTAEEYSSITVSEMKKVFKYNGVKVEDGFACFVVDCLSCISRRKDSAVPGKMYVNKTTGFFCCQRCQVSGQWEALEELLQARRKGASLPPDRLAGLLEGGRAAAEAGCQWQQLRDASTPLAQLPERERNSLLRSFHLPQASSGRGVEQSRCDGVQGEARPAPEGRVSSERQALYFPLLDSEGQVVGYKRLQREEPREQTVPQTGCGGVLALSPGEGASPDTAVLVSSVADLLALARHGIPALVVCLPHGFAQLPQEALPSLERHSKLVLWLGGDAAGWDAARTFARKLGERRCHLVRPTVGRLSPHEAVRAGLDPRDIVLSARPVLHQAITTFSSLREDVLSELHNIDKVAGVKWKRFQALNRILKGHRRGELTVLTGPTGSGKTTLVSELSLDLACQGVNTLWASFEIRNTRLARTMLQQLAGKPLDKDLEQLEVWADRLERLPLYFTTWHGQQAPRAVMEALEHAAYVHDIAHVVIDNVQFLLGVELEGQHGDRFWRQDALVASFRHFATHRNCHVTLVMHPRKERDSDDLSVSSIFGSAKAAQEADNILIIQDKRLTSVRGKKYLQVAKNRYTGDLGVVALEFHKEALSFAARRKKAEKPSEPSS